MQFVILNNGQKLPQLGFGVWQVEEEAALPTVKKALEVGYGSIDTASIYGNARGVEEALEQILIPRSELFVTTKVWNSDQGYEQTLQAFEESLKKLGLEYIDLYLIHWPTPMYDNYIETYKALEKLYYDGRVNAIGVCNFDQIHLQRLLDECKITPVLNQIECHPYLTQPELKQFCREKESMSKHGVPLCRVVRY